MVYMSRRSFCGKLSAVAATVSIEAVVDGKTIADDEYTIERYRDDVENVGLEKTWHRLCRIVLDKGENGILVVENFGELYEIGLAIQNKDKKKESGQYYTPSDVASIMSEWFDRLRGECLCDVGCGVGNLILAYLNYVGKERAVKLIKSRKIYLYDIDETALEICVTSILLKFGKDLRPYLNVVNEDFLSSSLVLPNGCKVITNPPYAAIDRIKDSWPESEVISSTRELYAAFMEKIIKQSSAAVLITPYSFIGGTKFYSVRKVMNAHKGFVVSFDNVPGTVFSGRKHGIFNSNTGNSVRAAITVIEDDSDERGFRFSPLIRFKATERTRLFKCKVLEGFLGENRQVVSREKPMFAKCDKRLEYVFDAWLKASGMPLGCYVGTIGKFNLSMPNTCRYFTVASKGKLNRGGQITLTFSDRSVFDYVFCMINSSFAYWFWRIYDGGITYPKGLLLKLPLFYEKLSRADKMFFSLVAEEMIARAAEFVITKNNVGVQENLKYPRSFRDKINNRLLDVIGINEPASIFDVVHSNMALEVNV